MGRPLGGKNRKFTVEEKYNILQEHYKGYIGWKKLCKKYNLSTALIYKWDVEFRKNGKDGLISKYGNNNPNFGKHHRHLSETEKLKEELLKKEIELMRLKKGYQVKGVGVKKEYVSIFDANMK